MNWKQAVPYVAAVVLLSLTVFFLDDVLNLFRPRQDVTVASQNERAVEMITVLGKDAIPSIDNPSFLPAEQAQFSYQPDELVMGVEIGGEARAYSVPYLSRHEIVNDTVNGVHIAVTW